MNQTRESPGDDSRAPIKTASQTTTILTRQGDRFRARRIRRWARRELDCLVGLEWPAYVCQCRDHWADTGQNLGVVEREFAGADLAMAGWVA